MSSSDMELLEVLAFVDAFAGPEGARGGDEDAQQQLQTVMEAPALFQSEISRSAAKNRRKETKYTTNLQRKKRAELRDLREQAAMLESRLKQLQQATRSRSRGSGKRREKKPWVELEEKAAKELEARGKAERENAKLRSRLFRQKKLREEIGRLIGKYQRQNGAADDGMSLLATTKSRATASMNTFVSAMSSFVPTACGRSRVAVPKVLEELIDQVDHVFPVAYLRSQSCWLETNSLGTATEIRTSTTADLSSAAAAELLWTSRNKLICTKIALTEIFTADGSHSFLRALLPMQCRPWDDRGEKRGSSVEVLLSVEHYARRVFDSASGRAILVTLALIRLPSEDGDVLLREQFWKCITPVLDANASKSITQTSYRIEPGNGCDSELSPAQKSVMCALVNLTRRNHSAYQDWLLDASNRGITHCRGW